MPLNPEIAAYLQLVEAGREQRTPMHQMTAEQARAEFDRSAAQFTLEGAPLARVESHWISARDGAQLQARLYSAQVGATGQPALLYLHGGGYVVGSLDSHDSLCRGLAEAGGYAVLAVAYRRAPEQRFPVACNDALDAWHWLTRQAPALGLDPQRLAVGGDSVGASLATVLARELALAQAPLQPRLQVLIYPVTDATAQTPSLQRYAEGHLLESATLEWFYQQYARQPADRHDPRFSPLLGAVPANSAPALVLLAECDPLHDEGLAYVAHLREAGVAVQLHDYEGMTHDFMRMGLIVEEADDALQVIGEALATVF
ncbi:alpha/beta hydrolase [Pseudomonas sp. HR96]|uniref:alpha/beta hydrolase n=1 Tax=Pseudomonas sp. HR96 TaxID=1027966 RepID=UPI002A75B71D|nr:alpha/beta hydrolase [Pseudomonas sp. HR96]WPP02042.1 alpha/beta hydrolase [Pseudomonas sp. HR96]